MSDAGKRLCTHTERGAEMYETVRDKYLSTLDDLWKRVRDAIQRAEHATEHDIPLHRKQISEHFDEFCNFIEEMKEFYTRTNTEKSQQDFNELDISIQDNFRTVKNAYEALERKRTPIVPQAHDMTQKDRGITRKSHTSFNSVIAISSEILKLRAKTAAAKVNFEYAEKEAALKKQNAIYEEQQKQMTASLER
jgi:hypothetical protein